jgi:hypothetical protein
LWACDHVDRQICQPLIADHVSLWGDGALYGWMVKLSWSPSVRCRGFPWDVRMGPG